MAKIQLFQMGKFSQNPPICQKEIALSKIIEQITLCSSFNYGGQQLEKFISNEIQINKGFSKSFQKLLATQFLKRIAIDDSNQIYLQVFINPYKNYDKIFEFLEEKDNISEDLEFHTQLLYLSKIWSKREIQQMNSNQNAHLKNFEVCHILDDNYGQLQFELMINPFFIYKKKKFQRNYKQPSILIIQHSNQPDQIDFETPRPLLITSTPNFNRQKKTEIDQTESDSESDNQNTDQKPEIEQVDLKNFKSRLVQDFLKKTMKYYGDDLRPHLLKIRQEFSQLLEIDQTITREKQLFEYHQSVLYSLTEQPIPFDLLRVSETPAIRQERKIIENTLKITQNVYELRELDFNCKFNERLFVNPSILEQIEIETFKYYLAFNILMRQNFDLHLNKIKQNCTFVFRIQNKTQSKILKQNYFGRFQYILLSKQAQIEKLALLIKTPSDTPQNYLDNIKNQRDKKLNLFRLIDAQEEEELYFKPSDSLQDSALEYQEERQSFQGDQSKAISSKESEESSYADFRNHGASNDYQYSKRETLQFQLKEKLPFDESRETDHILQIDQSEQNYFYFTKNPVINQDKNILKLIHFHLVTQNTFHGKRQQFNSMRQSKQSVFLNKLQNKFNQINEKLFSELNNLNEILNDYHQKENFIQNIQLTLISIDFNCVDSERNHLFLTKFENSEQIVLRSSSICNLGDVLITCQVFRARSFYKLPQLALVRFDIKHVENRTKTLQFILNQTDIQDLIDPKFLYEFCLEQETIYNMVQDVSKFLVATQSNTYSSIQMPVNFNFFRDSNLKSYDLINEYASVRKTAQIDQMRPLTNLAPFLRTGKVVYQQIKKINGNFVVITVKRNNYLQLFNINIYIPVSQRTQSCDMYFKDILKFQSPFMERIFPSHFWKYQKVREEFTNTRQHFRRFYNYFQSLIEEKQAQISVMESISRASRKKNFKIETMPPSQKLETYSPLQKSHFSQSKNHSTRELLGDRKNNSVNGPQSLREMNDSQNDEAGNTNNRQLLQMPTQKSQFSQQISMDLQNESPDEQKTTKRHEEIYDINSLKMINIQDNIDGSFLKKREQRGIMVPRISVVSIKAESEDQPQSNTNLSITFNNINNNNFSSQIPQQQSNISIPQLNFDQASQNENANHTFAPNNLLESNSQVLQTSQDAESKQNSIFLNQFPPNFLGFNLNQLQEDLNPKQVEFPFNYGLPADRTFQLYYWERSQKENRKKEDQKSFAEEIQKKLRRDNSKNTTGSHSESSQVMDQNISNRSFVSSENAEYPDKPYGNNPEIFLNLFSSKELEKTLYLELVVWMMILQDMEILKNDQNQLILRVNTFRGILREQMFKGLLNVNKNQNALYEAFAEISDQKEHLFSSWNTLTANQSNAMRFYSRLTFLQNPECINEKMEYRDLIHTYYAVKKGGPREKFNKFLFTLQQVKNVAQFSFEIFGIVIDKLLQQREQFNYYNQSLFLYQEDKSAPIKQNSVLPLVESGKSVDFEDEEYRIIYRSIFCVKPLMIITIFLRPQLLSFYVVIQNSQNSNQVHIQLPQYLVDLHIPFYLQLLKLRKYFELGLRIFRAFQNQLLLKNFHQLVK